MQKAASQALLSESDMNQLRHMRISELRHLQHAKSADCLLGVSELSELMKYYQNSPEYLTKLQQVVQQPVQVVPASNCCTTHGDIASKREDFQEMMKNHIVQLRRDGLEPIPINPSLLAITKYWDPFLKAERMSKKKQRDRVFRFTAQRVCKLHQFNRCNYGVDCRNIHICREFWANELSALLDAPAPSLVPQMTQKGSTPSNLDLEEDDDGEGPVELAPMGFDPRLQPGRVSARPDAQMSTSSRQQLYFVQEEPLPFSPPDHQRSLQSLSTVMLQPIQQVGGSSPALQPQHGRMPLAAMHGVKWLESQVDGAGQTAPFLQVQQAHAARSPGQPRHHQYLAMAQGMPPQPSLPAPAPSMMPAGPQPLPQPSLSVAQVKGSLANPLPRSHSVGRMFHQVPPQNSSVPNFPMAAVATQQAAFQARPVSSTMAPMVHPLRAGTKFPSEDPRVSATTASAGVNDIPQMVNQTMDWPWQLTLGGGGDRVVKLPDSAKDREAPKEKISNDEYRLMMTCVGEKGQSPEADIGRQPSIGSSEEEWMERLPLDLRRDLNSIAV
eukprot:GGOE01008450.1.p1 GENE.GGOE01008450.1~~GGOE01008450.1.p1  ORF type:complete len:578 (-),score=81.65 GGOE01008450.1:791-2452(-)